jgi:hypothetical protein
MVEYNVFCYPSNPPLVARKTLILRRKSPYTPAKWYCRASSADEAR